jgi:hypothetical protein
MESIPNRSTFLPVPRAEAPRNPAQVTQRSAAVSAAVAAPHFATLWSETVATFVTHAVPVFVSAWVGFAAVVAAIQCLRSLTGLTPVSDLWVFLAGAVAALLLDALAQGALAWIGLRGDSSPSALSLADALRAATAGWRRLLPGVLLHAVLTFVCALSLTPILLSSDLLVTNLDPIDPNLNSLPRLAALRSLDAASLGVLHPFGEWVAPARIVLFPMFLKTVVPDQDAWREIETMNHIDPSDHREAPVYVVPMEVLPAGLIALAGLALVVADAILLRFNAAAAMSFAPPKVPVLSGFFGPLLESARLGARHARLVLNNAVMLRLLMRAVQILCLVLTTSAAEMTILPQLARSTGALWVLPVGRLACIVGSAAVSALLTAFCTLYDARLYVALQRIKQGT